MDDWIEKCTLVLEAFSEEYPSTRTVVKKIQVPIGFGSNDGYAAIRKLHVLEVIEGKSATITMDHLDASNVLLQLPKEKRDKYWEKI